MFSRKISYKDNIKSGFKKYCYLNNASKKNQFNFIVLDNDNIYQDAEIISMNYRILEELKLEDVIVRINSAQNYDLKVLQEQLEQLDIDYEVNSSVLLGKDNLMAFEFVMEIKDKTIILAAGFRNISDVKFILSKNYLYEILPLLDVIYEDYSFDILTQVLIVAEAEEERIVGMKLAQDLRWCEIKVELDTLDRSLKSQFKVADRLKARTLVILNSEDLAKGIITVKDNLTHEEVKVDENEIIDFIMSNL